MGVIVRKHRHQFRSDAQFALPGGPQKKMLRARSIRGRVAQQQIVHRIDVAAMGGFEPGYEGRVIEPFINLLYA